jgi:hypothetical protein
MMVFRRPHVSVKNRPEAMLGDCRAAGMKHTPVFLPAGNLRGRSELILNDCWHVAFLQKPDSPQILLTTL